MVWTEPASASAEETWLQLQGAWVRKCRIYIKHKVLQPEHLQGNTGPLRFHYLNFHQGQTGSDGLPPSHRTFLTPCVMCSLNVSVARALTLSPVRSCVISRWVVTANIWLGPEILKHPAPPPPCASFNPPQNLILFSLKGCMECMVLCYHQSLGITYTSMTRPRAVRRLTHRFYLYHREWVKSLYSLEPIVSMKGQQQVMQMRC